MRKRCYFGCIICGHPIIEYHHFDPEFVDAKKHIASKITLLCGNHHREAGKGILPLGFIEKHNENPYCKREGRVKNFFYIAKKTIDLKFGSACFKGFNIICHERTPLIRFDRKPNGLLSLSAKFFDNNEKNLFHVIDNEWQIEIDNFDIELTKNDLIVREKVGKIKLHLSHIAEKEIYIKKLDMNYKGFKIEVKKIRSQDQMLGLPTLAPESGPAFKVTSPQNGSLQLFCPNIYSTLFLRENGSISLA